MLQLVAKYALLVAPIQPHLLHGNRQWVVIEATITRVSFPAQLITVRRPQALNQIMFFFSLS
jgi:hypothetical protein